MRSDKKAALKLRIRGRSYNEINKILGIPRGTLSGWFTDFPLSEKARHRILSRVNAGSLKGMIESSRLRAHLANKQAGEIRKSAREQIQHISKADLFFIGVVLYWGEGYKRPIVRNGKIKTYHAVVLSNSDPQLVVVFLKFLRVVCGVQEDMIRVNIHAYEHQNQTMIRKYWSKVTGIREDRFQKTYFGVSKASKNRRSRNTLPYGTLQIRVNSTLVYHKIMGWIEGIANAGIV